MGVLDHSSGSSGLLPLSQGLQGLQTWAWTKSKGLLWRWHLLNPQRLLKGQQDTLTHTSWHQWQFSQQSPPLSLMTTLKLPLQTSFLWPHNSPLDHASFTYLVQLFLPLWHQWQRVLLSCFPSHTVVLLKINLIRR